MSNIGSMMVTHPKKHWGGRVDENTVMALDSFISTAGINHYLAIN